MIAGAIRQLCALSLLCGAAMSIAPEGTVKRVLEIVCSAVLVTALIQPFIGMDLAAYALQLARLEEREAEFLEKNGDLNGRLNRLVIEEEAESYIMDKAGQLGAELESVQVTAEWSVEGLWVPSRAELTGPESCRALLEGVLAAELGIPAEKQQWSCDGTTKDESG